MYIYIYMYVYIYVYIYMYVKGNETADTCLWVVDKHGSFFLSCFGRCLILLRKRLTDLAFALLHISNVLPNAPLLGQTSYYEPATP